MGVKDPDIVSQCLITPRLSHLPFQGIDSSALFLKNIVDPEEVRLSVFQFTKSLFLLFLEFSDPGRLLKHLTTVLRLRTEEHIYLSLLHDRIGRTTNPCIHEKFVDITKATQPVINPVFRFAVPENPAGDSNLMVFSLQRPLAFGEVQGHFRHWKSFPSIGTVENHVCHLTTAESLGRGLPEDPANRINHIRLPAAIWTYNPCNPLMKLKGSALSE